MLVEGKLDEAFLQRALALVGRNASLRISYLEQLAGGDGRTGGVDELKEYVKQHASAIKSRTKKAPVLVALDWDSASKKPQFERWFQNNDPFGVLVWEEADANPRLSRRFRGIERFLSSRIIEAALQQGAEILQRRRTEIWTVEPEQYEAVKLKLAAIVQAGLTNDDLVHVQPFLQKLTEMMRAFDIPNW
jgi:hypothetical protein